MIKESFKSLIEFWSVCICVTSFISNIATAVELIVRVHVQLIYKLFKNHAIYMLYGSRT